MLTKRLLLHKITAFLCLYFIFLQQISAQEYTATIRSVKEFARLQGLPLSDKYGRVESVKVVYDIKSDRLYYINSSKFRYHFNFCDQVLGYNDGPEKFNSKNYFGSLSDRTFLLANVNYYTATGAFLLEISPYDYMMDQQSISLIFQKVKSSSYFGPRLKLLLNSAYLENLYKQKKILLPVTTPGEVYKNQIYQPISKFSAYGTLRIVGDKADLTGVTPSDIILIKGSMFGLPPVAGVITTDFQTPLSHVSILAINRRIPCMAYKLALADSSIVNLNGKFVHFTVKSDTFYLNETLPKEIQIAKHQPVSLKCDFTVDSLLDMEVIRSVYSDKVGNKAANFSVLYNLSKKGGFKVPENSFAIPFYFYKQHVHNCKADSLITCLLNDTALRANYDSLRMQLKAIRNCIINSPIDKVLLATVETRLKHSGEFTRYRFRSSTNAEDMKGFSGAGLYSSKTGIAGDSLKSVEMAIKVVWASLWKSDAFLERELFAIDHHSVAMGVLVHRSFPDEAVNGVAVTKNIYRSGSYGFIVNAQPGDISVVIPEDEMIPEQFVCYPKMGTDFFKNKTIVEIISYSSLSENKLTMSESEIMHLANSLEKIKRYIHQKSYPSRDYLKFGLELEFKLDGNNRSLYFDQVRVYND